MVSTELHDLPVRCLENEFYTFDPPSGQSCYQWAGQFVEQAGGYLQSPNATDSCQYCIYSVGDEFYEPLSISVRLSHLAVYSAYELSQFSDRGRDIGILIAFAVFNGLITLLAAKLLTKRYSKR